MPCHVCVWMVGITRWWWQSLSPSISSKWSSALRWKRDRRQILTSNKFNKVDDVFRGVNSLHRCLYNIYIYSYLDSLKECDTTHNLFFRVQKGAARPGAGSLFECFCGWESGAPLILRTGFSSIRKTQRGESPVVTDARPSQWSLAMFANIAHMNLPSFFGVW